MYPDPKRVRDHRIAVRLDDYEYELLLAMAHYRGQPLATFMRELLMQRAEVTLQAAQQQANKPSD